MVYVRCGPKRTYDVEKFYITETTNWIKFAMQVYFVQAENDFKINKYFAIILNVTVWQVRRTADKFGLVSIKNIGFTDYNFRFRLGNELNDKMVFEMW